MFYSESFSRAYRLGDIITGYTEIVPVYALNKKSAELSLSISVIPSDMFVILTPCCSIEQQIVNIAPLKKIDSRFLSSDFLVEDFLLINQPITRREALGGLVFNKLTPEEKLEFENMPPEYSYLDKFIYAEHHFLKEYSVTKSFGKGDIKTVATGKHMVSFKDAGKIQCNLFERKKEVYQKIAELSPLTRQKLRDKMAHYYSRIPEEDRSFLG